MKFELSEGCMAYGFYADNKRVDDLNSEELKEAIVKIANKINNTKLENEDDIARFNTKAYQVLYHMVYEFYDKYDSSDEPCECCGDWVETYELEV